MLKRVFVAQSGISVRGFRAGLFFVVLLVSGVAGFALWDELRAFSKLDTLLAESFERARLISLIRVDTALLIGAVRDHISADSDEERRSADEAMEVIFRELQMSTERISKDLPKSEAALWERLNAASKKLVRRVDKTVKYSNRREYKLAIEHLEDETKPLSFELDELAGQLVRQNAEETKALTRQLENARIRSTVVSSTTLGVAVIIALLVTVQVSRLLRRQQDTIVAQLNELNARNAELDAFASRVAHDLVAPLAPLKGFLTLARRQTKENEIKELLAQAEAGTARMSELVDALLKFCRAGKPGDRAQGELDTAVSTILLEAAQAAAASNVALERELEPRVRVACAPQLLQSIAQNILSNAVKYSAGRVGAKVTVKVKRDKTDGILEVIDNGLGMSADTQAQLFKPFFRAPESKALPGHGLGLATTKRLVEAHGGTLVVKSRLGAGTQMTVRLPLADTRPPQREPGVVAASALERERT